jgi:phosphatidylinositol glycan class V
LRQHSHLQQRFSYPHYELTIQCVRLVLSLLFGNVLSHETLTLVSAFLLSNTFFLVAVVALYRLSINILESEPLAYTAALIFCFNPASIFMSATYSESLFAALTFGGCYYLSKDVMFSAAILFSLASLTRSNGVVLIGFLLYHTLYKIVSYSHNTKPNSSMTLLSWIAILLLECVELVTLSGVVFLPLSAFQYYSYQLYCKNVTTSSPRPWCSSGPFIPSFYNFVQSHYWNVGFLQYYTVKQIPNFLVAAPIVIISVAGIIVYISNNWKVALTLGLIKSQKNDAHRGFFNQNVFVFIVHWSFLVLFACLMMHIQVTTRFVCSQVAPFYWFLAHLLLREPPSPFFVRLFIFVYLFAFNVIGTLLFVTFYPWT